MKRSLFVTCLLIPLFAGLPVVSLAGQTATPSEKPFLRIEIGTHIGRINRFSVDARNRYLVTASYDKTVRVWDAATGIPLSVLRPPIGAGDQGKMYAVAVSPDGNTIACGGYTSEPGGESSIYLFHRDTGRMFQRITGLPNVVWHLAYSPDGRYLAATIADNGIRLYRAGSYTQVAADNYGNDSLGMDWAQSGGRLRLVTSAMDGVLRLYELNEKEDVSLHRLFQVQPSKNKKPVEVAFSPDGAKIAVGYDDAACVLVVSGDTLAPLYQPDTEDTANATFDGTPDFPVVCWSADGRFLYAGGWFSNQAGSNLLRKWADAGQGRFIDIPVAVGDSFKHLLPRRAGGLFFVTDDAALGTVSADDACQIFHHAAVADFNDNSAGFLVSQDGGTIRFGYENGGKSPAVFSLREHTLTVGDAMPLVSLTAPLIAADGLDIRGWKEVQYTPPTLNGKPLEMDNDEAATSLAIAPDRQSFLLGSTWSLRCFDRTGAVIWQAGVPDNPNEVNVSGDSKIAIAAFNDGTIRWYRMTDGQELFAFFPHGDRRRWVLWAPSGYYDCSLSGGADLVGWQFNRGSDQAGDFVPLAHYSASLYRPDVLAQTLNLRDGAKALRWANDARAKAKRRAMPKRDPRQASRQRTA